MLQWITSRLFARTSGLVWIHLLAMAPRRRWWPPPPALLWMANASPPFLLLTHAPDVVVVVVLHVARATVCQWTSGGQQQMATRMDGRTVPDSDPDGWWQSIIINVGSTSVAAFRWRFFFFAFLRTGLPTTTTGLWTVRRWPCHTPCRLIPLGPEPRTRPYRDVGRNLLCCCPGWTLIYAEWHL